MQEGHRGFGKTLVHDLLDSMAVHHEDSSGTKNAVEVLAQMPNIASQNLMIRSDIYLGKEVHHVIVI